MMVFAQFQKCITVKPMERQTCSPPQKIHLDMDTIVSLNLLYKASKCRKGKVNSVLRYVNSTGVKMNMFTV